MSAGDIETSSFGTMPLLVINMGGEMLYILEQRLRAQSIPEEKSLRGMPSPCLPSPPHFTRQ